LWRDLASQGLAALGADSAEAGLREILLVFEELGRASCPAPLLGAVAANLAFAGQQSNAMRAMLEDLHHGNAMVALALGAFALGVYGLLYLRRSLSIIPEARRLVTRGPYRFIRHPLYAAEILAACALVLARPGLWATLTLVPFIAVQMLRARFEEGLLTRIFPEYRRYAAQTRRLIPLVW